MTTAQAAVVLALVAVCVMMVLCVFDPGDGQDVAQVLVEVR